MSIDDNDDNYEMTWEDLNDNYMYNFLNVVNEIFDCIDLYLEEEDNCNRLNKLSNYDLQKFPGIKLENYKLYKVRDDDLIYALKIINEPIFKIDTMYFWLYEKDISEMRKEGIIHKAIFKSGLF